MLTNKKSRILFVLSLILFCSCLCINSMKSFAAELNPLVDSAKEQMAEFIDKRIIYPSDTNEALLPGDESAGISIEHEIHMPYNADKYEVPPPFTPSKYIDIESQPMLTESELTVDDEVYGEENSPFIPYELLLEIEQNDDIVEGQTYNTFPISNKIETVSQNVYTEKDQVYGISDKSETVRENVYNVKDQLSGTYPIKNKGGFYKAGFSKKSGLELLNFSYGNSSVFISPVGSEMVSGKVNLNTITYPDIYPGVDLRYTLDLGQLKEELILKDNSNKNEFLYKLRSNNVKREVTPEGIIIFSDPDTGEKLFRFDKPFAVDSNGSLCEQVSLEIENNLLKLTIDSEWLKKAVYPVTIDPTITLLQVEFYKASTGFSSTQGLNNWYYEEQRSDNNYYPMTWDGSFGHNYWVGADTDVTVRSSSQTSDAWNSVRRWKAPHDGNIMIWCKVYSSNYTFEGIYVKIMKNDTQIWPATGWKYIVSNNTPAYVNLSIPVVQGDDIRFFSKGYETISWNPVITYNTNPEGIGLEPYWNYTNSDLGAGWGTAVNTSNLNFVLKKSLFAVPGRGLPIGDSITYNSMNTGGATGPLGNGWSLGTDSSICERTDGSIQYIDSDGTYHYFSPDGSGGYTSPQGVYLTLIKKDEPGEYLIKDKKQNKYRYYNGKPGVFLDQYENTTSFTYDPTTGRLTQITDPSGRTLTYTYNSSNYLESVTDPAGRSYQFSYQNNRLYTITDPLNNVTTFNYDQNGYLSSFTDSLNRITSFTCDSYGKLQSYQDARTTGQDIYETSFVQSVQDNKTVTTVTDPGSRVYTYYHDINLKNLTKYQDQLGNNWQYNWDSNNLLSVQDAKGTTSYEYDKNGNITKKTTTVDSNSSNNIIVTMTYDSYNQLKTVTDGSGRIKSYEYDNKGKLLSSANPYSKESNGRKYDQYGNVIEYSPRVSGNSNLLVNGSLEGTSGWTAVPGGSGTVTSEGFNSHGNSALKFSSTTSTTKLYGQNVSGINPGDKLTLRADVKLESVVGQGAIIRIKYITNGECQDFYESWYLKGNGTQPIVLTSQMPEDSCLTGDVCIYIGLSSASGTAWFDGVQLEKASRPEDGFALSAFSSVENGGFENGRTSWGYTGVTPIGRSVCWGGNASISLSHDNSSTSTIYQNIPVYGGEPLTFSGMVKVSNVNGTGAYFKLEYYNASNVIIPHGLDPDNPTSTVLQTSFVTGNKDFTRLSSLATAPATAKKVRVTAVLEGTGMVYFDDVKLVPRNSERYTYSAPAKNYVATSEDAYARSVNYTYNENVGTKLSFTDASNNTTYYTYDSLNRLTGVTDPLNNQAYYNYDDVSNLIAALDPRSTGPNDNTYKTIFSPNPLNHLDTLTDPLAFDTISTYDRSGNLIEILYPNGKEINYSYNSANLLEGKTLDGGKYFNYTYDGAYNLIEVINQDNKQLTWEYDNANRIKKSTGPFGKYITYNWDKSNNITSKGGNFYSVSYQYGSDNALRVITLPNSGNIYYHYDDSGRIFQVRYPGSYNYRNISYLPNGWLYTIQDPAYPNGYHFKYYYYDNGNIDYIRSWAGVDDYSYDVNGRLTYWKLTPNSGSSIEENYEYDAAGNLLTKGTSTYTYDSANRITNSGFTYDNNGNLTSNGILNYIYNAENQLIEVRNVSDQSLVATYEYNFNGSRRSKTVNGQKTLYHWDTFGNMSGEFDQSGNVLALYYYSPGGKLIGLQKNSQYYVIHDNLRGDVVSITDYTGSIKAQYNYDPWGKQLSYSGTLSQPFRYAGYYYDEETGLYYCKSRYYSPTLGRFLTKDDISYIKLESPQTLNPYVYANNNPVCYKDPNGNSIIGIIIGIAIDIAIDKVSDDHDNSDNKKKYVLVATTEGDWGNYLPPESNYMVEQDDAMGNIFHSPRDPNTFYTGLGGVLGGFATIGATTEGVILSKGAAGRAAIPLYIKGGAEVVHGVIEMLRGYNGEGEE